MPVRIYKRGETWHYRGTVANVRIRGSTRTTDKATAQRVAAEIERREWRRHLDGPDSVVTMGQAIVAYLDADKPPADVAGLVDALNAVDHSCIEDCFLLSPLFAKAANALTALSARVAEDRGWQTVAESNQQMAQSWQARAESAEAAFAGARDAMESALARLDASLFTNAEHQQAKDILRAMKGKP